MIKEITCFQTTDNKLFEDEQDAKTHETEINFRTWCEENICIGSNWTSNMVANEILENYHIIKK